MNHWSPTLTSSTLLHARALQTPLTSVIDLLDDNCPPLARQNPQHAEPKINTKQLTKRTYTHTNMTGQEEKRTDKRRANILMAVSTAINRQIDGDAK